MMEPEQFGEEMQFEDYVTRVSRYYAEELIERGVVPGPILIRALGKRLAEQAKAEEKASKQEYKAMMREVDMILINRDRQQRRMRWTRLGRVLCGTVLVSFSVVGAVQAGALLGQDDSAGWWFAAGALACLVAFVFVLFDWPGRA